MNDDTMANQEATPETREANEEHSSSGNKPLDAQIVLSNSPDDPSDKLAATNLSSNNDPDDPSDETNPEIAVQNNNLDLERSQDSQPFHRE